MFGKKDDADKGGSTATSKGKVIVRILVGLPLQGKNYQPNNLVAFEENVAKGLVDAGKACDKEASIAYCKDEGFEVIEHEPVLADKSASDEAKED